MLIITNLLVLFAMIAVGFGAGKMKLLSEKAFSDLTAFLMQVTLPCMIFNSMMREFDSVLLRDSILGLVMSLAFTLAALGLNYLAAGLFRVKEKRRGTFIFAASYGNTGFIGIPIINALLGPDGVFVMANSGPAYLLVQYTLCIKMMCHYAGGEQDVNWKKILLSRPNFAMAAGLIVFLTQLPVPEVLMRVISSFAGITTPLSMFVIGLSLAKGRISDAFKDRDVLLISALRLLAIPLLTVAVLRFLPFISPLLRGVLILCAAMPCPSLAVIFSQTYGGDVELGSRSIFLSSIACLITIPLITMLI